jgi:O-antigen ligase
MSTGNNTPLGPAPPAALVVLIFLVIASPWPYGSTHPFAIRIITLTALFTSVGMLIMESHRGGLALVPFAFWPLLGLLALGAGQLIPLPMWFHSAVAPGSFRVWHPTETAVAAVLGPGPRPVSVLPEATRQWLAFTAGLAALALLAAPALRERRRALAGALTVIGVGFAVALYGIVARTFFGDLLYGRIVVPTVAPFGPFVSKNHFSGYVEMAALLALGLAVGIADEARRGRATLGWVQSRRAGRVVFAGGAAVAMALAVLVSLSRGGALSLALGLLAFVAIRALVRHPRHPRAFRVIVMVSAVVATTGVVAWVLPQEARERLLTIASGSASALRLSLWRDTLHLAASSPLLGFGFGAFQDALPPFKTDYGSIRFEHAENDYLETLVEGGLLGLLLAVSIAVQLARPVLRGLGVQEDRLLRGLGMGAAAGLAAVLVHSFLDFNLRIPSNGLLATFLAALVLATAHPSGSTHVTPRWLWAAGLALSVWAVASARAPTKWLPSTSDLQELGRLRTVREYSPLRRLQGEGEVIRFLQDRPGDGEAWIMLSWLHAMRGSCGPAAALARQGSALEARNESLQHEASRIVAFAESSACAPKGAP